MQRYKKGFHDFTQNDEKICIFAKILIMETDIVTLKFESSVKAVVSFVI